MKEESNWQHEGTGVNERLKHLKALEPYTFLLDEQSIADHLRFVYDLSKRLNYYDLDENINKEHNWSYFLSLDVSIQLSRIATVSMTGIDFVANKKSYERYLKVKESKSADNDVELDVSVGIIQLILDYTKEIHQWGLNVNQREIKEEVFNAIQHELNQQLFVLVSLLKKENTQLSKLGKRLTLKYNIHVGELVEELEKRIPLWRVSKELQQHLLFTHPHTDKPFEHVNRIYLSFEKNIARISRDAKLKLDTSFQTPTHQPHIGLLLAFFQLWESHMKADFNSFTKRHLDFYYKKVLNLSLRQASSDYVHAYFKISPDVNSYLLPKGSRLFAGKDRDGRDIFYETISSTPVTSAEIGSIKSILVETPTYADSNANKSKNRRLVVKTIKDINLEEKDIPASWAPFGEITESEETNIGLAVASPMLYLLEGRRKITVDLFFRDDANVKTDDQDNPPQAYDSINELLKGINEENFTETFSINLSTAKGWEMIDQELISDIQSNLNTLSFTINLEPTSPAIIAFPVDANPESYTNPYPQLKILLKNQLEEGRNLAYGLLKDLVLRRIDLKVSVQGVRKLSVQNDFGPLDPAQAFQPFGVNPEMNSNFFIGSNEVFYKPLNKLSLHLEWAGLPANKEGMGAYYKDYDTKWLKDKSITTRPQFNETFANDAFLLSTSQLKNRNWETLDEGAAKYLFNTDATSFPPKSQRRTKLASTSRIEIDNFQNPTLPKNWVENLENPLLLSSDSLDGFIRLQLTKESSLKDEDFNDVFGHMRYPIALADAVSYNSQQQAIASQKVSGKITGTATGEVKGTLNVDDLSGDLSGPFSGRVNIEIPFGDTVIPVSVPISGTASGKLQGPGTKGEVTGKVEGKVEGDVSGEANPDEDAEEANKLADLPLPPYTPLLKSISLDYEAFTSITSISQEPDEFPISLIHIYPFGTASPPLDLKTIADEGINNDNNPNPQGETSKESKDIDADNEKGLNLHLLPHFKYRGNLMIGISDLVPPAVISLLFIVEDGSHTIDEPPERIQWSYLSDNKWEAFEEQEILEDNTNNFTNSGTILFQLPSKINRPNSIMAGDFIWIKAAVLPDSDDISIAELGRFSKLKQIYTNGVKAIRSDDSPKFIKKLEAGRLEKLLPKRAEINEVVQPAPSFGGKQAEDASNYYIRVAEGLKHKMRAIGTWDFERIILETFPDIFKVKCINHSRREKAPDGTYKLKVEPGNVLIIVIPKYKQGLRQVFARPRASQNLLRQIKGHLQALASPLINIQVINPVYEEIEVGLGIEMVAGKNTGENLNQLEFSLQSILSPWTLSGESQIEFGREVSISAVLGAVRQKDYVKAINIYTFKVTIPGKPTYIIPGGEKTIKPSMPWSVLSSSSKHRILTLSALEKEKAEALFGIPYQTIEDDFYVESNQSDQNKSEKKFGEILKNIENSIDPKDSMPDINPFIHFRKDKKI